MDARPPRIALCIMAKAPASGQVKTRLCPPLSPRKAAGLYRCFLEDETAQVREVPEGLCASGLDAAIVIDSDPRRLRPDFSSAQ